MRIEPWGPDDGALVRRLTGDPAMMGHLGGAEDDDRIADRQRRYAQSGSGMFKIVDVASGEAIGSVGYWERTWHGEHVCEAGWAVLPGFQGRGVAASAVAQVIAVARAEGRHRFMHAFPSVDHAASNAICRKAGFTLLGDCEFEYPPGSLMHCNDWRLDLSSAC